MSAPQPRLGLLWRGDRTSEPPSPRAEQRLAPLLDAFAQLPVDLIPVVFAEQDTDAVRDQLLALDGVMAWVNPIQDGQNRAALDTLLREAASHGVWVSAHPDTIQRLGTKQVLHTARDLPWGSDIELYTSEQDFTARFPARLATYRTLVVKQGRGNGGNGVWKVSCLAGDTGSDRRVAVQDASRADGSTSRMPLHDFIALAADDLAWSGCLIDQPFQPRVPEGALRCYFSQDQVVGFCRQWPVRGLLNPDQARAAAASARRSVMEPADAPGYRSLRQQAEHDWLPKLLSRLELPVDALPAIWDADLLLGDKDTFVLCEINTSAVWPFPPTAAKTVAATALTHLTP
ncbi:MAG TPA: Cj0069 family protein [Jatrophihabitans sp.]|nr:Cj0069 family protein [Jatrophihabitans sp.]